MRRFYCLICVVCFACASDKDRDLKNAEHHKPVNHRSYSLGVEPQVEDYPMPFDSQKWQKKEGDVYPFRPEIYREVLYSKELRSLSKPEVLRLLGPETRSENNHYYYTIDQVKAFGFWSMKLRSLVVKFDAHQQVEWIKLYE
jgi:hypothetical protein